MAGRKSIDLGATRSVPLARPSGLPDEIAKRLRNEVLKGTLKAGDKLPSEQQLCRMFGVSRPVVREAISRLKYDGVLESFQGRGVFVREDGSGSSFRIDDPNLNDQRELAHIIELLVAIEGVATGLAAGRRSNRELKAIKAALDAMAIAIEEGRSGVDEDLSFHRAIVEATRNSYFIALVSFLESRVRNLIRIARTNTARYEGLAYEVQEEHEAIYRAITARDPDAAKTAAERHLRNAAARLKLYQEERSNGARTTRA
ncbi:MAG: FadR family transcriptional regulator [Hyphomicrobiaceae bacterium]|nr:FadR family transcriptional regulator [Hyphomicrobiaceae bacterium]